MGIGNFFKNVWRGIKDTTQKVGGFISDFAGGFSRGLKTTMDAVLPIVSVLGPAGAEVAAVAKPVSGALIGASDLVGSIGKAATGTISDLEAAGKGQASWKGVGQGVADRISQGKQDFQSVRSQIGRLRGAGK